MGWTSALIVIAALIVIIIKRRDAYSDHGWREEAEGLRQRFRATSAPVASRFRHWMDPISNDGATTVMGWTAPRTASACQDGRCRNSI